MHNDAYDASKYSNITSWFGLSRLNVFDSRVEQRPFRGADMPNGVDVFDGLEISTGFVEPSLVDMHPYQQNISVASQPTEVSSRYWTRLPLL